MTTQQVLARKWRPKTFQAMVGQQYVLQALENALTQQRLHHAYLFTGTRGVGKTSLARILAKCLNCETGVTAKPCGICSACQAIDRGTFIDLIEVDAASRTKVEDTRELLDNVQYLPTVGRFKIYLIDEVHMLSGHSFNALLKTLEEPPPHVKFLLATTDPHKLPVTVLSRCLQFHLKHLPAEEIAEQLRTVLEAEHLPADAQALNLIAQAAQGSMRDGLSLLDQAIGFCAGHLATEAVRTMLGTINPEIILNALTALQQEDGAALLSVAKQVADESGDFEQALKQLGKACHDLTVLQTVNDPGLAALPAYEHLAPFIGVFSLEDLQLYYQVALNGSRDIAYAPSLRTGFEMSLLRMLAFRPATAGAATTPAVSTRLPPSKGAESSIAGAATASAVSTSRVTLAEQAPPPLKGAEPYSARGLSPSLTNEEPEYTDHVKMEPPPRMTERVVLTSSPLKGAETYSARGLSPSLASDSPAAAISTTLPLPWDQLIVELKLSGMAAALASHCVVQNYDGHRVVCMLSQKHAPLHSPAVVERIAQALSAYLKQKVGFEIKMGEVLAQTPAQAQAQQHEETFLAAQSAFEKDPIVQGLRDTFGAKCITSK